MGGGKQLEEGSALTLDFSKLDKEYLNSYEDWGMHVQMLGDKPRTEGYYQVAT